MRGCSLFSKLAVEVVTAPQKEWAHELLLWRAESNITCICYVCICEASHCTLVLFRKSLWPPETARLPSTSLPPMLRCKMQGRKWFATTETVCDDATKKVFSAKFSTKDCCSQNGKMPESNRNTEQKKNETKTLFVLRLRWRRAVSENVNSDHFMKLALCGFVHVFVFT